MRCGGRQPSLQPRPTMYVYLSRAKLSERLVILRDRTETSPKLSERLVILRDRTETSPPVVGWRGGPGQGRLPPLLRGPGPVAGATPPKKQQGKAKGERERAREGGEPGTRQRGEGPRLVGSLRAPPSTGLALHRARPKPPRAAGPPPDPSATRRRT